MSKPHREPGRARKGAARLAGCALLLLVTGCSAPVEERDPEESTSSRTPQAAATEDREQPTCETVAEGRQYCGTVTVSGQVVRYAYVPARAEERELILVDRGGPGATLFGPTWPRDLVERLGRTRENAGLVLLEEPWVTHRPSEPCAHAMSSWQQTLREGLPMSSPADVLAESCGLTSADGSWSWTPRSYGDAVRAVERSIGARATRFVGASFAGTRVSYLDRRWASVSLVSPLPAGVRSSRLVALRQAALDSVLRRCTACARGEETHVEGRSVPVTDFDREAAAVALGYYAPRDVARLRRAVLAGTTSEQLLVTGRLSDSATGRIGTLDMSPAVLAIMAEQCPAFGDLGSAPPRDDVFFARYFSPCVAFVDAPARRAVPVNTGDLCVSVARGTPSSRRP